MHFRRRKAGRTNYGSRLNLLKSGKPRMVVRKTNRYVIVQFCTYDQQGDRVVSQATSRALKAYGFAGKCNAPSAYLTGFLAARQAISAGITEALLDIGLHTSTQGSIVFCAQKGAVDAGMKSPLDEAKLPKQERIIGAHLKQEEQFGKAKKAIEQAAFGNRPAAKKVEKQ